ncbi:hypothetical protein [Nitrobacter sp. TKz-YC02]|uniref:hypothetical protein n=1 Tax=Nitrobacter sp. TKz-YC02 TaxID=3398704 RepID=UPI003CEB1762
MNELVERRAATVGTAVAEAVVGTIPDFRSKEGAGDKVLSAVVTRTDTKSSIVVSRNWIGRSAFASPQYAPLDRRTS